MAEGESTADPIKDATPLPPATGPLPSRSPRAWQPLTPRGIAAFATAGLGRLFVVELLVALVIVAALLWFLFAAWIPILELAMRRLPPEGIIQGGQLKTPRRSPAPLADGPFLAIGIDIDERTNADVGADLYVKFHRDHVRFCSRLPGCAELAYPADRTWQFNRPELESAWGAWKPFVLGGIGVVVVVVLLLLWGLQATIYWPIIWVLGHWRKKQVSVGGAWKAASATLMPGGLLFAADIWLYGLGLWGLVPFCVLAILHLVVAWVYLFLVPWHLREKTVATTPAGPNPFAHGTAPPPASDNPFRPQR